MENIFCKMAGADKFEEKKLMEFKKDQLVKIIVELQKEKEMLVSQKGSFDELKESFDLIKNRVTEVERSHLLYLQYGRRESVEITGIPTDVTQDELESEVIKVYKEAGVSVFGREVASTDISACHRIGRKKEVTIVRFVNRKFAMEGLFKAKNLKDSSLYGRTRIFINNSFCHEYKKFGWIIRELKKASLIDGYKVKNGVHQIKTVGSERFVEISHVSDFTKYNLDISAYN